MKAKFLAAASKLSMHDIVAFLIVITMISLAAFGGDKEIRGAAGVFLIAFITGYEFARTKEPTHSTPSVATPIKRRRIASKRGAQEHQRGSVTGPVREVLRTRGDELTVRQIADQAGLIARLPSVAAAVSRMFRSGELIAGEAPNTYKAKP